MLRNAFATLLFALATVATAQTYPAKPVKVIVPWPPAGVSDILARALAQALTETSGQPLVVENKPGPGGTIRPAQLATSAPDRCTPPASDLPSHAIRAPRY